MAKTLVKMDQYNTFRQCQQEDAHLPRNAAARVDTFIAPLLAELSKKRPAWQFVSSGWGDLSNCGTHYSYHRFTIMEDGEELGWVDKDKDWRSGGYKYEFDGPRLRASRTRAKAQVTKDLKKAVKTILGGIYALTLTERMSIARKEANSKTDKAVYPIQRDYRQCRDVLSASMVSFVLDNWEAFSAYTMPDPATERARDTLRDRYERLLAAEAAESAKRNGLGAVVVERGNAMYVEYDNKQGQFHHTTVDKLPDNLKLGVAMLKLVEPETMVDYVGVRVDAKTYYVFSGLPHE